MIADLKPYPALKGSDDLRIGEIPEHWEIEPLCAIAKLKSVKNQYDRELLSVYLNLGVVPFATVKEKRTNATSEDLSSYQAVDPGDFVLNNQQAWRGSVGVSMHKGIVSPAYLVLSLGSRIHPRYANLLLRERSMVAQYLIASKGVGSIQRNLYWPHLKRIPIILPPLSEQSSIVRFLDIADRKIRRYIRVKQKLIKLLEEQKQAIIVRAITRGLDPSTPFKPSGIPWLGDIPQHWRIVRNMALFAHRVEAGVADYSVLQVSLRSGITAEDLDQFGRPKRLIADPTKYKRIYKDDIAYNTMRMWQGAVGVSPCDGLVSPAYVVLSPRAGTCPGFYDLIFHTDIYKQQVNRQSTGIVSDRNRLYWDSFKQMVNFALPRSEQEAILAFIGSETCGLNIATSRLEREIGLLREFRTRLIADVVTGKLDVREAAAQLPDEDQELPLIDESDEISDAAEVGLDDLDEGTEDPEP